MRVRVESVSRAVRQVRQALGSRPPSPADSLIRAAEENLELVSVGRGAHNIPFADELLRAAVRLATEAAEAGGANPRLASVNLGQPLEAGSCTSCHFGVDGGGVVSWQGRSFPHRRHTVNAGFDCQACHTPMSEHGGLTLTSTESCDNCHHISDSPRACAFCHDAPGRGHSGHFASRTFLHDPHLEMGLGCDACHKAPSMAVQEQNCATCHSLHHVPHHQLPSMPRRSAAGNGGYGEWNFPPPTP